jgi:insulysin
MVSLRSRGWLYNLCFFLLKFDCARGFSHSLRRQTQLLCQPKFRLAQDGIWTEKNDKNATIGCGCYDRREFLSWGSAAATSAAVLGLSADTAKAETINVAAPVNVDTATTINNDPAVPFSSDRRYKTVTLTPNGLRVLLVSDKRAFRASAALTIQDAGQFADTLPGIAHLMEHMVLSFTSRSKLRKARDFEDWLADKEGGSNAFTGFDKVCFHFSCPADKTFGEALDRFAGLFLENDVEKVCRNRDTLKREIRRVDSEIDFSEASTQAMYLLKSFVNPEHPFSGFSRGDIDTLERMPKEVGIDVGEALVDFFRTHYLPEKAVLAVVGPQDLFTLERFVAPFAFTLSKMKKSKMEEKGYQRSYPGGFLVGNRSKQMVLYNKQTDGKEKMSIEWSLNLDYSDRQQNGNDSISATHISFILAQILGRRGPGSLDRFLIRRGWIPSGVNVQLRIVQTLDVSGFQIIRLDMPLTEEGFINRAAIVAAVYGTINSLLSGNTLSRALISQYAAVAKIHGYVLTPRPPDAVELAIDAQIFYGINAQNSVGSGQWYRFPDDKNSVSMLQRKVMSALRTMSDPENAVIIATAGNKAISRTSRVDEKLPTLSSGKWLTEPITRASFCFDEMLKLSSRFEEIVLTKLVDNVEIQSPVLNPLVPATLRPARIFANSKPPYGNDRLVHRSSSLGSNILGSSTSSRVDKDDWVVLSASPTALGFQSGVQLPRIPLEPTCRAVFVLNLLSSRPARANIRQAAQAELWKRSFENAVAGLTELGAPGGLSYEMSFNRYGLRLSFLGISQTLPSYARRFARRLVDHHYKLLDGPEILQPAITAGAVMEARMSPGLTQDRRRRVISSLRRSTAIEAATEGILFLRSCHGAVCFAQGDMLSNEVDSLLLDMKQIFSDCTGSNSRIPGRTPSIDELNYMPRWKPRGASPCALPGMLLIHDACGRIPR